MSILSTEQLGHSYHDRWLFKDLHFGVERGDRFALVGINGTGKSTLLKILAGIEIPTAGKVVSEKDLRIGYLDQDPRFENFNTINDFIFSEENEALQLIKEYENLLQEENFDEDRVAEITERITAINAWEYEHEITTILSRLGITKLDQEISTLSGGQQKRLSLAKLLISDPDVYLLDEPTNHLDIETIEWLESLLTTNQKTVIFVTHDRYFLDNVCTEIRELDHGKMYSYKGKYSYFLEKKAEREALSEIELEKNLNLLRKELEWMRRQPKARGTKSKSRIAAFHDLEGKTKKGPGKEQVNLSVKIARQGNKILEINNISKSFNGNTIIGDFSYVFKKGDRIGLAGKNGTGKSTFLNLITKEYAPDSGNIDVGETTVYGYYRQNGLPLEEGERVIDVVKNVAEYIKLASGEMITASQLLTQFLFPPEKQFGFVNKLSGGERKRLQLMRVLMKNPNFLILDEPSNDLDIDTLNVLEDFLEKYQGILILVSHDRYLLDRLSDQLFVFTSDPEIVIYNGNYSDFKVEQEEKAKAEKTKLEKSTVEKAEPSKVVIAQKNLSFKEEQEIVSLEKEIETLEETIKEKTIEMNGASDHNILQKTGEEIQALTDTLEAKSDRWLELLERKG